MRFKKPRLRLLQNKVKQDTMINGSTYFDRLIVLYKEDTKSLPVRIKELRKVLQDIALEYTKDANLQFSSLFARLDYIFKRENISGPLKRRTGSLRYNTKNPRLISGITEDQFKGYLYVLAKLTGKLSVGQIPEPLKSLDQFSPITEPENPEIKDRYEWLRGIVEDKNATYIIFESEAGNQFRIPLEKERLSAEYQDTLELIKPGCNLSLINVKIDVHDHCLPQHIIFEPDYLLDISSVAECFQEISGKSLQPWQLYFIKRLLPMKANPAIFKGNVVNFLLDELLYADRGDGQPKFQSLIKDTFRESALEYTVLFDDDIALKDFIGKIKIQYENLNRIVQTDLTSSQLNIDKSRAILEPSFISEKIGLQGRLDLLEINEEKAGIIELKSGRLPWPEADPTKISENHAAQARMYRMILNQVYGLKSGNIQAAICYSAAATPGHNLRTVPEYTGFNQRILNLRNIIVHREQMVCSSETTETLWAFFNSINFDSLGIHLNPKLEWFRRDWDAIKNTIDKLDNIDRNYFFAFYRFIVQELMLSKIGDGKYTKGHSALWNKEDITEGTTSDRIEQLSILSNESDNAKQPHLVLKQENFDPDDTFNFRKGDICVLYKQNTSDAGATSGQIFKCSILEELNKDGTITVVFRYKQNTKAKELIFDNNAFWCLEHDSMDHSYNSMFKGLFSWAQAERKKRDLISGRVMPVHSDIEIREYIRDDENKNEASRREQNTLLSKALAAKDYFLLIGPPGTGKTSMMLKHLVRELHKKESENILVLAYTNRAVDEICDAVNNAVINFDDSNTGQVNYERSDRNFIRIGSRLSTSPKHHHNLLQIVAENCNDRAELSRVLKSHRIFVSTIASIANKTELFNIKNFDTVIVDEASQVLEPQITGLLSQFKKFILIGDHKQLPAVTLQDKASAKRFEENLTSIGVEDLRESYFERLLRLSKQKGWNHAWGILSYQGRMHEEVATFPNYLFYNRALKIAGLTHQKGTLPFPKHASSLQQYLKNHRMVYIPSETTEGDNRKVNEFEAKATAILVKEIISLYEQNSGTIVNSEGGVREVIYQPGKTIGIITPYRNQISRIKKELEQLEIPDWESIAVDTVERYQGSQRDIIVLSLCINSTSQLEFLASHQALDQDSGELVDRKLNVALTRAKEQMIILGNPYYLSNVPVYYKLIQFIKSKGGLIDKGTEGVIKNNVNFPDQPDQIKSLKGEIQIPDPEFREAFEEKVMKPVKENSPDYPENILGYPSDYNRATVIGYGRANFDEVLITHTPEQRTLLYCYYNMRKHYFSQLAIFKTFDTVLTNEIKNHTGRLAFFDWGCGPCTAGMALQTYLKTSDKKCQVSYFGIDISTSMLGMAEKFLESSAFGANFTYNLTDSISGISETKLEETLENTRLCIFNFSYFFGNISTDQARRLAEIINDLIIVYPLSNYYVLFQNTAVIKRNHTYNVFKRALRNYTEVLSRREDIQYKNEYYFRNATKEKVYYELLKL